MATTSSTLSQRIRGLQRVMRDARLGTPMTLATISRAEATAAECAAEAERLELASGAATITAQLRAAGDDVPTMKRILAGNRQSKAVQGE